MLNNYKLNNTFAPKFLIKHSMTYHHLSVLVHRQAKKYGDRIALKYRDYDKAQWMPIGWDCFSKTVKYAANALIELGVGEQENIGIFSQNKPECLYVDFGAFANRAVTIPLYATSSPSQVKYIVDDAGIRFLFVGEQFQYDTAFIVLGLCNTLQKIIIFDRAVVIDPVILILFILKIFWKVEKRNSMQPLLMSALPGQVKMIWQIFYIHLELPVSQKGLCFIILVIYRRLRFMMPV